MNSDAPRNDDQIAALKALCRRCPRWDAQTSGCKLLRACERKALTRSLWHLGHCPCREERKW